MENTAESLCRLCLKLSNESVNLFHYKNGHLIADLVKIICPVTIERDENEKLPNNVCIECLELIVDAIHLRDLSIINDEELRRKTELPDDQDDNFEFVKLEDEDQTEVLIEALDEAILDEEIQVVEYTIVKPPVKSPKKVLPSDIQCEMCDNSFCNVSSFKRHMRRKHKDIFYSCDLCSGIFKIKLDLRKHIEKKHFNSFMIEPLTNDKSQIEIDDMYEKLEEPYGLSCCFCPYIDYDEESLNGHMLSHQSVVDTGKMYCDHCPCLITSMEFMIKHARSHNEVIKTHRCLVCYKVFCYNDKFLSHLRNHKKTSDNFCYCPECGRKFTKQRLLEDHIRFIHNKESLFSCEICNQGFGSKSALNGHIKRHNDGNKFECPFCPKKFCSKNLLNSHKIVHSNDRPFACAVCDKTFKHQKVLNDHIKRHTGERPVYICSLCTKPLNSAFALNRHMLTHTGSKPHHCEFCQKSYAQKNDLNKHIRLHIGQNTYFCNFQGCEQSFRILSDLRIHEADHYLVKDDI